MTLSMTAQLLNFITIGPWEFNGFDVVVLVILLISMLYAASRGLLREVISITSLLVASIIALYVYGRFRFDAREFISPSELADGILAVGAFAISYLILVMIMSKIGKSIAGKESGFIDRVLGAAFGVARGLIIAALLMMVFTSKYRSSLEAQAYKDELRAQGIYDQAVQSMPKSMREQMEQGPQELPPMFANSVFYPLLDKIGAGIRSLPLTQWKSYAERVKEGDIKGLSDELLDLQTGAE